MARQNFLLGKGERLVSTVTGVRGGSPKQHPYTFSESRSRLAPMLARAVSLVDDLPAKACPDDKAVLSVVLNPEYIAKSFFPKELFQRVGVEAVGSRTRSVKPQKRSMGRPPEEALTTEIFVMGPRASLRAWSAGLPQWNDTSGATHGLISIEEIGAPDADDKLKGEIPAAGKVTFEVVLHTDELLGEQKIVGAFRNYLASLGVDAPMDKRFYAGGLCFIELTAPAEKAEDIAIFTAVRALREMPTLRVLRPTVRAAATASPQIRFPSEAAVDPNIRVAIFDGGIPDNHPLTAWSTPIDTTGVGTSHDELRRHGVHVTSAFLFGHIDPTKPLPRPYAPVQHYRVLDTDPSQDPEGLYEVLYRIDQTLMNEQFDLVNISLGPRLPIEDDDVHAWTAVLDDRLARNDTLATIAVGNDGERDAALGFNRIQVPADCVNAMAVGAADSPEKPWSRAPYSSVGPGRSPGLIKPDLVDFGGSIQRPFLVASLDGAPQLEVTGGTSFASPSLLRMAAGVKAHLGANVDMLAIRALLIHTAEESSISAEEVGRGRVARTMDEILLCDDDTVRVIYQGNISARSYVRAPIPVPLEEMSGKVQITATICYKTLTDPHHPGNYTRAGLEIAFRPKDDKRKDDDKLHADTQSFFGKAQKGLTEGDLRRDAWKWENTLHASVGFLGKSLRNPAFDIHYNARLESRDFAPEDELRYALVVSVKAKRVGDLYDQIVRRYQAQLEPLRPVVDIPIRT
ncbi:S8 family peptidase [Agrobacterium tumefaciens]|uniref:S8 family peptidase n=1 Tax=Agrobacterium tumefaciens TaxID=358 RepID=UPI001572F5D1|nr:S8 family peptidase [Agrobacterium tumefaciens]MCZ7497297.1 S8 family peptidase [Rhizobium rhizogenes]NTE56512.1 S8 family peptidase [Agrobacterium tumefaciens]NTE74480.1 S8 family peptidase [Agrobacterium tumefaciens]